MAEWEDEIKFDSRMLRARGETKVPMANVKSQNLSSFHCMTSVGEGRVVI